MNQANNQAPTLTQLLAWTCLLLSPLLLSANAWALPEDKQQPIKISADTAELNDQAGTATYTGTVQLIQGSLQIDADQLVLHTDSNGEVDKLIATGQPAHFQQQHKAGEELTHGYGLTIEFDVLSDILTLTEQAKLLRASDTFAGKQITINTLSNVVQAQSDKQQPDSRVQMVIQPRSSKTASAAPASIEPTASTAVPSPQETDR